MTKQITALEAKSIKLPGKYRAEKTLYLYVKPELIHKVPMGAAPHCATYNPTLLI